MAIDASAYSVGEYAATSNDPLIKKIGYSIHEVGSVLRDIPMPTKATLRRRGMRWLDNLPTVSYTPLNTAPVVTKGKPTPWAEQVYVVANQFQIDEFYLMDENQIENPLDGQVQAWIEHAFKFDLNGKFINNGHTGAATDDPNAIVGIKHRLSDLNPNGTSTYGTNLEMNYNAAVTMTTAMTAANAEDVIEVVQTGLDYMNDPTGSSSTLYCNDIFKRRFERAVRLLGGGAGFDTTRDAFDRSIETYKDMKIQDLGRVAPTVGGIQTGRIVSTTEDSAGNEVGGSTGCTSFYIVRYGADYFTGWQMRPLKSKNLGLDPTNGSIYNVVIRWAMGLWQEHTRALFRGYGCRLA